MGCCELALQKSHAKLVLAVNSASTNMKCDSYTAALTLALFRHMTAKRAPHKLMKIIPSFSAKQSIVHMALAQTLPYVLITHRPILCTANLIAHSQPISVSVLETVSQLHSAQVPSPAFCGPLGLAARCVPQPGSCLCLCLGANLLVLCLGKAKERPIENSINRATLTSAPALPTGRSDFTSKVAAIVLWIEP